LSNYHRISDIQADLTAGKTTCVQLVQGYLARILENKHLNAFLEVWDENALARAAELDQKVVPESLVNWPVRSLPLKTIWPTKAMLFLLPAKS